MSPIPMLITPRGERFAAFGSSLSRKILVDAEASTISVSPSDSTTKVPEAGSTAFTVP